MGCAAQVLLRGFVFNLVVIIARRRPRCSPSIGQGQPEFAARNGKEVRRLDNGGRAAFPQQVEAFRVGLETRWQKDNFMKLYPAQTPAGDPTAEAAEALRAYYAEPAVRRRMVEFLGGDSPANVTCQYIAADDRVMSCRQPRPSRELWDCLERNLDISRALWDRESLVAHLDVEYVNFDHPAEAYQNPERVFALQKPVEETITILLRSFGIIPLRVLSGRGFHFIWRIGRKSPVFQRLAQICPCGPSLQQVNARLHPPNGESVLAEMGSAYSGLGLVMEFLAHRVKELASGRCAIPIELTAVEAGPRVRDREMISIDISEFGDPLHTRTLRAPFSVYHKPSQQRWLIGEEALRELPLMLFVPLQGIDVCEALKIRRDTRSAAKFARQVFTVIPEQAEGTGELLGSYLVSSLGDFHRWFYSQEQHPPEMWAETYDRTPMDVLPKCARAMLERPNDVLLHPVSMRLVTRVLLALGWHPRHIAGLICSKFARNYGWGDQWLECDPAMRADFYTRVFAGLFVAGRDDLVDFNCQSSKEERICPVADCPHNLEVFRQSALARRHYDQLAHQPFNRLFLPTEHP